MTIALPSTPLPNQAVPRLRVWGGPIGGDLGGEMQNIILPGTRFALDVTMPRMKPEPDGRIWPAALCAARARGSSVTMPFPQPGLDVGTPGSAVVNGASQLGSTLALSGMTAGYVIRQGQFLSIYTGGRHYLHQASADTIVAGGGTVSLPITPMLRKSPANGAAVEFAAPVIEGFLEGNEQAWTMVRARTIGIQFTIAEAA
jgi:hypothetical protein